MSATAPGPDVPPAGEPPRLRLERFLPYRLSLLSHLVTRGIAAAYEGEHGLSTAQWRVLAAVAERPGITAGQVVDMTPMDKVAVSRAVAALDERGLVTRAASARDRRSLHLRLTAAGEAAYREIAPRAAAFDARLQAALGDEERRALLDLTGRLIAAARALQADPKTPDP